MIRVCVPAKTAIEFVLFVVVVVVVLLLPRSSFCWYFFSRLRQTLMIPFSRTADLAVSLRPVFFIYFFIYFIDTP